MLVEHLVVISIEMVCINSKPIEQEVSCGCSEVMNIKHSLKLWWLLDYEMASKFVKKGSLLRVETIPKP